MKNFVKENQVLIGLIVGSLIIGSSICFTKDKNVNLFENFSNNLKSYKTTEIQENSETQEIDEKCNLHELTDKTKKLVIKVIYENIFIIEGSYLEC